jgi:Mg/Co/Ni transporter MgtE
VVSQILDEASPDVATDILKDLPLDRSWEILRGMKEAGEVVPLLQHPDDTAGGVMIPDYPVVRESTSAANALDQLRFLSPDADEISAIFVVDDENKLWVLSALPAWPWPALMQLWGTLPIESLFRLELILTRKNLPA